MAFPLENARLCLDCDTVFDEPRCPSCSSETYFPLSRWVRPSREELETGPAPEPTHKVRNTSLVLGRAGVAFALWKFLKNGEGKTPTKRNKSDQN